MTQDKKAWDEVCGLHIIPLFVLIAVVISPFIFGIIQRYSAAQAASELADTVATIEQELVGPPVSQSIDTVCQTQYPGDQRCVKREQKAAMTLLFKLRYSLRAALDDPREIRTVAIIEYCMDRARHFSLVDRAAALDCTEGIHVERR